MKKPAAPASPGRLRNCAFVPACLLYPVLVLDDGGADALVDLRTLVKGLGMAWVRWDLYVRDRGPAWGVELRPKWDRQACYVPSATVPRWLAQVHHVLSDRAARRAEKLRLVWREEFDEFLEAEIPRVAALRRAAPVSRKITAETVRILYAQRQAGATWLVAAEAAGIALSVAKKLAANRYSSMSADAQRAWALTFGAGKAAARPKSPAL